MHTPWSQQDSGITLSTGVGMIGVLEITLIVPTLRVGMPLRTLRVRSRMWRRCVDKLQRHPRHALGSLNPQSVPFVTRSVTGGMPTRSDGHDQCWSGLVYNDERSAWECLPGRSASALECVAERPVHAGSGLQIKASAIARYAPSFPSRSAGRAETARWS